MARPPRKRSFDDDDLAEVAAWVEEADHDNEPDIKRAKAAAREAEKDQEWD